VAPFNSSRTAPRAGSSRYLISVPLRAKRREDGDVDCIFQPIDKRDHASASISPATLEDAQQSRNFSHKRAVDIGSRRMTQWLLDRYLILFV